MKGKYLKGKTLEFDGSQLTPLWAYSNVDLQGDSIVAFRGPCSVSKENMVDITDRKNNSIISSPDMMHFLVEYFDCAINEIILIQRLLVTVAMEAMRDAGLYDDSEIEREGDNIYAYLPGEDERRKMSVSVATVSPLSGLVHLGMNVSGQGAPVRAAGLADLGVDDVDGYAVQVLQRFIEEIKSARLDASRVRPVC